MADKKISQLDPIVTPTFADIIAVVQGGVNYKETKTQLRDLLFGSAEDYDKQMCDNPRKGFRYMTHLSEYGTTTPNWTYSQSSAQNLALGQVDGLGMMGSGRFGLSTSGGAFYWLHQNLKLGLGKFIFEYRGTINSNSDGKFQLGFILTPLTADADQVNGVYMEIDERVSANIRVCAAKSSVRTKTNGSLAHNSSAVRVYRIEVNADLSGANFLVDGNSIGTVDGTNIPLDTTQLNIGIAGYKYGATATALSYADYFDAWCKFTNPL